MTTVAIEPSVLYEFKFITSCDIQSILQDAEKFLTTSYDRINAYFAGKPSAVTQADFIAFETNERQITTAFSVYTTQKSALGNLKFWLLLDHIEDIDSRLKTLRAINKWNKSSQTNFAFIPSLQVGYTSKSNQTLERIAQDVLKKDNPQDDWYDIAITNQLREEDYTPAGGTPMQLSFPQINNGIDITCVVAAMTGDAILGRDFQKKLQFANDDLVVLNGPDTALQAINILANLRKNDMPDFPALGLQSAVAVGSNRGALNFPVITRQFTQTFGSDDSLKNFTLNSLTVVEDGLYVKFTIQTRLNETTDHTVTV